MDKMGFFYTKWPHTDKNKQNWVSREWLMIQTWFIAHFNQNMHFTISISYITYVWTQQKWLKWAFFVKIIKVITFFIINFMSMKNTGWVWHYRLWWGCWLGNSTNCNVISCQSNCYCCWWRYRSSCINAVSWL